MAVELQTQEKTLIAILSGEIDHHCAQPMRAEIDAKIDDLQPSVLVLDFAGVTFMDSSGIGLIMGRHRTMEAIGGTVIVRGESAAPYPPGHSAVRHGSNRTDSDTETVLPRGRFWHRRR